MSTEIEVGGGAVIEVSTEPAFTVVGDEISRRHVRLTVWIGRGGTTVILPPAKAIEVARALLSHAGAIEGDVESNASTRPTALVGLLISQTPSCSACQRGNHLKCGGPESGCGCAYEGHTR